MKCRVEIYRQLSEYQQKMVDYAGYVIYWTAVDKDERDLFANPDISKVINFANKNKEVTRISKYVKAV